MKFNWGHGIIVVIALGIAGLATLVILSTRTKIDLVTEEYYPKELKYQEEIEKSANSRGLAHNIEVQISDSVYIHFPTDTLSKIEPEYIKGNILFYRPSDKGRDISTDIKLNPKGYMTFPLSAFSTGKYELKIDWTYKDTDYLFEEIIIF